MTIRVTLSSKISQCLFINALLSVVNRIFLSLLLIFHQEAILTIEEAFGEVIRELRKAQNFSQEKLAEASNLDRSFISLLECGHKQPSLITIFQIAKAFNLPASRILSLTEDKITE
jgi:DNA-binding XRE family transcriptional regulator